MAPGGEGSFQSTLLNHLNVTFYFGTEGLLVTGELPPASKASAQKSALDPLL